MIRRGAEAAEQRSEARTEVDLEARVRELGGIGHVARIANISIHGCGITACALPERAEVWLQAGGLPSVRARVVWSEGLQAGLEFYAPVDVLRFRRSQDARPLRQVFAAPLAGTRGR